MLAVRKTEVAMEPLTIRCERCGAEQALSHARGNEICALCTAPLFAGGRSLAGKCEPGAVEYESQSKEEMASLAEKFSEEIRSRRAPSQLNEIAAANKRLSAALALVPVWGPFRLSRSTLHTPREKRALGAISIMLTLALFLGLLLVRPSAAERASATRALVGAQIEVLRGLVESYGEEHPGERLDATVWERSAKSADLRFYDPWGHLYFYQREGVEFIIGTYGRDGVEGGSGEDADVVLRFAPSALAAAR